MKQMELFDLTTDSLKNATFIPKNSPLITFGMTCEYNRKDNPDDTYEIAAKKLFNFLTMYEKQILESSITINPQITVDAGDPKFFKISRTGIDHNYELDLWHSWMVLTLHRMVREAYFYRAQ